MCYELCLYTLSYYYCVTACYWLIVLAVFAQTTIFGFEYLLSVRR